jgi:hypothetical protein
MATDFLKRQQFYQQTLRDISSYIRYCYASVDEEMPSDLSLALQGFDDLESRPFSRDNYRFALRQGATLMVDNDLSLGDSDKERVHIFAALQDLGYFVEADVIRADFVL